VPDPDNGSIDIEALDNYLMSERSPPDCMDVSQLDGFLAGVVIGPEIIAPSEFLPVVWAGGHPVFVNTEEAGIILGSILGRYNEIAATLDTEPSTYSPVFWQDRAGNTIVDDWSVGFMQAVALRSDAWEPALLDDEIAMLLIPIGVIAGLAEPGVGLHDISLSDDFLDELMQNAGEVLPSCVLGLRAFWRERDTGLHRPDASSRKHHH